MSHFLFLSSIWLVLNEPALLLGTTTPKFVRDGKKYGRRSRPENQDQGADTPLDFPDISDVEMDYSSPSPTQSPIPG